MTLFSKRSHEGYLLIDHSNSPGTEGVPGGKKLECSILTCKHCHRGVVIRPDRTRARPYCPKCDHYICDLCEAIRVKSGGLCNSFDRIADKVMDASAHRKNALDVIKRLRADLVQ